MADAVKTKLEEEWPADPNPMWLGEWAAKQNGELPYIFNLRTIRDMYQARRRSALEPRP